MTSGNLLPVDWIRGGIVWLFLQGLVIGVFSQTSSSLPPSLNSNSTMPSWPAGLSLGVCSYPYRQLSPWDTVRQSYVRQRYTTYSTCVNATPRIVTKVSHQATVTSQQKLVSAISSTTSAFSVVFIPAIPCSHPFSLRIPCTHGATPTSAELCCKIEQMQGLMNAFKSSSNISEVTQALGSLKEVTAMMSAFLRQHSSNATNLNQAPPSVNLSNSLTCQPLVTTLCLNAGKLSADIVKVNTAIAQVEADYTASFLSGLFGYLSPFSRAALLFWPGMKTSASTFDPEAYFSFTVCNFLFPLCEHGIMNTSSRPYPTCSESCEILLAVIELMKFLPSSGSLTNLQALGQFELIAEHTCLSKKGSTCVHMNNTLQQATRDKQSETEEVRFSPPRLPCISPFVETNVSSHYLPEVRDLLRKALNDRLNITLDLSDAVIDQVFPCGLECITPGHDQDTHTRVKAIVATASWLVLICSVVSCAVYLSTTKDARFAVSRSVHGRLVLAFNITFLIMSLGSVPASFKGAKSFICFPDDTLRRNEPSTSFLCSFFGALSYAGLVNSSILLACLAHQWVVIIRKLRTGAMSSRSERKERVQIAVYFTICLGTTITMTTVVLVKQQINGSPVTGTCGINFNNLFYFLTIPIMFFSTLGMMQLAYGIAQLYLLRKASIKNNREMSHLDHNTNGGAAISVLRKSMHKKSQSSALDSTTYTPAAMLSTDKVLLRLIMRLLVYIVSVTAMVIINIVLGIIVQTSKDSWVDGTYDSIICQILAENDFARSACPAVPKISEVVMILLLVIFAISGVTLSTWILAQDFRSRKVSAARTTQMNLTNVQALYSAADGRLSPRVFSTHEWLSNYSPTPSPRGSPRMSRFCIPKSADWYKGQKSPSASPEAQRAESRKSSHDQDQTSFQFSPRHLSVPSVVPGDGGCQSPDLVFRLPSISEPQEPICTSPCEDGILQSVKDFSDTKS